MATVEESPDDLLNSLAYVLSKNLPLLRRLAGKPKHEIARRQVEHLKQAGVEKIVRHVAALHSWPPRDPPADEP
jgi:hypothetical protein